MYITQKWYISVNILTKTILVRNNIGLVPKGAINTQQVPPDLIPYLSCFEFYCYACGSWLFLFPAFLSYSLILFSMLWTSTWIIQQKWSLFVHIPHGLFLCICNPTFKKCQFFYCLFFTFGNQADHTRMMSISTLYVLSFDIEWFSIFILNGSQYYYCYVLNAYKVWSRYMLY